MSSPISSSNSIKIATITTSSSSATKEDLETKVEELQRKIAALKRQVISNHIDPVSGKLTISDSTLKQAILQKVDGIYDEIKVEQVNYLFGGLKDSVSTRKITLKRTFCKYDLCPLIPFFSSLFANHSIYRRTIDTDLIAKYVLNADISIEQESLDAIFEKVKAEFLLNMQKKNKQIEEHKIDTYRARAENPTMVKIENEDYQLFLKIYEKYYQQSGINPRQHLMIAYWQSKTITIYIPNSDDIVSNVELKSEGIATPLAIEAGKFFRFFFHNRYQEIE